MSSRGFTLLELMIILGIIGILVTIAYPSFQRYHGNGNLRSAARDLIGDFNNLRQRAMSWDNPAVVGTPIHRLSLDVGANSYTLQRCIKIGDICDNWEDIQTKSLSAFGNDIVFDPGNTKTTVFVFEPRGTVTFSSDGCFGLRNNRGSTAQITANISGRTFVEFTLQ